MHCDFKSFQTDLNIYEWRCVTHEKYQNRMKIIKFYDPIPFKLTA